MYMTHGLHRCVQIRPNDTATVFANRRRTWRELRDRVARFAGGLRSLGLQRGDRIAILALNSDRYIETYFAVAWAGGVIVPGNTRWSAAEHVQTLRDSGASMLIVDRAFPQLAQRITAECPMRHIIHLDDGPAPEGMIDIEQLISTSTAIEDACGQGQDLAGIFYTGGTTGRAKGVMVSQGGLVSAFLCTNSMAPYPENLVYLHSTPMFHLSGASPLIGVTIVGGTHVVIPFFTPESVVKVIAAERVTASTFVPTMFALLRDHLADSRADLSSMTNIFYAAAPISETLLRQAMKMFPSAAFMQAYGQSEIAGCATILESRFHRGGPDGQCVLRSAGRPVFGLDVKVVDEAMNERPRGEVGEIVIRSPGLMLGYWNQPELTQQTVVDGWVKTGDAAYMDQNGFVFVVDRVKDMIVSGGENVYSAEVENALSSHLSVGTCAVIGVPDSMWGERVHAIVVLKEGSCTSAEELIAHCKALIATYKCPRSVEIRKQPLPISGAGKILKAELRKPYWETCLRSVG
jgi:long-chain acyl-CoA synthetase